MTLKSAVQTARDRIVAMLPLAVTDVTSVGTYPDYWDAGHTFWTIMPNYQATVGATTNRSLVPVNWRMVLYSKPLTAGVGGEYWTNILYSYIPDTIEYFQERPDLVYDRSTQSKPQFMEPENTVISSSAPTIVTPENDYRFIAAVCTLQTTFKVPKTPF